MLQAAQAMAMPMILEDYPDDQINVLSKLLRCNREEMARAVHLIALDRKCLSCAMPLLQEHLTEKEKHALACISKDCLCDT